MQKLLTSLISIFILFFLVRDNIVWFKSLSEMPKENDKLGASGNFIEKAVTKIISDLSTTEEGKLFITNVIENTQKNIASAMLSREQGEFLHNIYNVHTSGDELGKPCLCSQNVVVDYKISTKDSLKFENNEERILLGQNKISKEFDNIVVGMKKGQTRTAMLKPTASNKFKEEIKEEILFFNITLKDIIDKAEFDINKVKIFDDKFAYQMPLLCGDSVEFNIKITKINGDIIYNSNNFFQIKIGDSKFQFLSFILNNKIPVTIRTVLAPWSYINKSLKTLQIPINLNTIPGNEYVIIELLNSKMITTGNNDKN